MQKDEEIFEYLEGNDDDGNAINFNVETKQTSLTANFETIINPAELIVELEYGNGVKLMISYDNGPFITVDSFNKGCTRKALDIDPSTGEVPRCRQVTIAYREFSKSQVRIGRLALGYYITSEVEEEQK